MKLGTHNSLSYLRPQWWMRPFAWMARCQSMTIEQQYEFGVRYFDIRMRLLNNGDWVGAHGLATYDIYWRFIFAYLNFKGDCIVRILLENHFWQKNDKGLDQCYIMFVYTLMELYPNITFTGGQKKRDWTTLVNLPDVPVRECFEKFEGNNLKFPFPKKYAKRNNPKYWKSVNDIEYSLFDFIELDNGK